MQAFPAEREALEALGLASCPSLGLIPSFPRTEKKICCVTSGVKGRLGAAVLLNGGLILSAAGESTGGRLEDYGVNLASVAGGALSPA